jgi:hypothetical protein
MVAVNSDQLWTVLYNGLSRPISCVNRRSVLLSSEAPTLRRGSGQVNQLLVADLTPPRSLIPAEPSRDPEILLIRGRLSACPE